MSSERIARQFAFIIEADRLKEVFRQTLLTQSRRPENDAEHSWHICLMTLVLAEHSNVPVDALRVLKMLTIHDLVEIDAGDTYAYDTAGMSDQHERECVAADRIFGLLPDDQATEFRAIWDEFEARDTPEAKFAAAMDRIHPMLLNILTQGEKWRQHGVSLPKVIARNEHAKDGAAAVWAHAVELLNQAVAEGYLPAK